MSRVLFNLGMAECTFDQLFKLLIKETQVSEREISLGECVIRHFPDGETYQNVLSEVRGKECILVVNGVQPDAQFLNWVFMAENLKELGAKSVGLLIPYLPYMRQDIRFKPGECVSSRHFAKWVSQSFDWLVTTDPHLHRYNELSEIYSIPTNIVPAAPVIAQWVKANVVDPVIIGPDSESQQWVQEVATLVGCEHEVLLKERSGDRDVKVSLPTRADLQGKTPVLVDDIISTGRTMAKAIESLIASGMNSPICIGVHPLFSDDCIALLKEAGAEKVVSCNTLNHPTAEIDMVNAWVETLKR